MGHDDRLSLEQMFEAARGAHRMAAALSHEAFEGDEVRQLAVVHLIQVLGEAASRLSGTCRDAHPELPWAQIIGMRNRIVHAYDHLDADIVWRVATEDLEAVMAALERILVTGA